MPGATLDISEARRQLNTLDQKLTAQSPVIYITRHNRKAFVAVNLDFYEALLETLDILADPETLKMLDESIQDIRAGRVTAHEDVEKLLDRE